MGAAGTQDSPCSLLHFAVNYKLLLRHSLLKKKKRGELGRSMLKIGPCLPDNSVFSGTTVYILMESMPLPWSCNILNSAEVRGFP